MRHTRGLWLAVLLALPALNQCASVSKAPTEQSDTAKSFEALEDRGVVYLYRRGRAIGAATSTEIKINGITAGGTGPSTFFMWKLKPGQYTFSAYTKEASAAVELDVEAGKLYFVEQIEKIGLDSGRVKIQHRDEATGKAAVKGFSMLVSAYVPD